MIFGYNINAQDYSNNYCKVIEVNNLDFLGVDSLMIESSSIEHSKIYFDLCSKYINEYNLTVDPKINGLDNYMYLKEAIEYNLQLVFAKSRNTDHYVWINCIHKSIKLGKPDELIVIADGGFKYFNFWVNLTTGQIIK